MTTEHTDTTPKVDVVDADAFLAAITGNAKGPVVKMYGQQWQLAADLPVLLRLRLARATSTDEVLTVEEEQDLVVALLGEEQHRQILRAGLSSTGTTALILTALAAYAGNDPGEALATLAAGAEGGEEGNPRAPQGA